MTGTSKTTQKGSRSEYSIAGYDAESNLVDFILGITFEIWEQGRVANIHDYYATDVEVYSLEGMTRSADTMVENTHNTIAAFPDRLLLANDVITTGTAKHGFSSHRIFSPMTNRGDTNFGTATGQQVQTMNIADCEVNNGLITREWLVRDNLALIRQLGFDPLSSARIIADRFDERQRAWLASEYSRTFTSRQGASVSAASLHEAYDFALDVLAACWLTGDEEALESSYAPYCIMHRAPLQKYSGRDRVFEHYSNWRDTFPHSSLSIDHICSQPFDANNQRIAVRWSIAGAHEGEFSGAQPSGKPIYILGVTHWEVVDGRISAEWTVFDELAMLAQTLD